MDFEKLYYEYYKEIFQFAFKLSLSQTESEDLLQEAFAKLFKESKKNIELENPRAWLYKVVLNLWRNKYNKTKSWQEKSSEIDWEKLETRNPETDYINQEKRSLVFNRLKSLEKKDREILNLYHEGLSYAEIAEVLDMNPNSVGKNLSRSIQKFKSILKTEHHELFE